MQIGILIGLMALSAWGSMFLFALITQADTLVGDAQKELASLSIRQEQITTIAKEYESAHALFAPLEERLLPREERLRFIMLVEGLAAEAGVVHEISTADDTSAASTEKALPVLYFNITLSGGFPNILRFIYLLEHSRYYLGVQKAQVIQGGGTAAPRKNGTMSSPDDVKAQLSIKVYTQ
ncbi:MAG: hypothetical protein NUV61_01590 [Candidatus Azambacteria bacterium]|nr:hypothetical protein [Candidatus Azambacteria bacterium]